jgi:midasin
VEFNGDTPRKRRKLEGEIGSVREAEWITFEADIKAFDVQHVQGKGKIAFGFVEGPLVDALRKGSW